MKERQKYENTTKRTQGFKANSNELTLTEMNN